MIKLHHTKLLLTLALLALSACGGGTESLVPDDPPVAQEPIVGGATLGAGLTGRAVIGEAYTGQVVALPLDARNQITGYSIRNTTAGGGVPSVSSDGGVTWAPNEADINTSSLELTVSLAKGEPASVVLSLPVPVYAKKLVMSATLMAGQYLYSDAEGNYTVQLGAQSTPTVAPVGTVRVYAYMSLSGSLSYGTESSDPNYYAVLRDYPRASAALSGLTTQFGSIDKKDPNTAAGLQQRDEWREFGFTGLGAVIRDGYNAYTTRNDPGMVKGIGYLFTVGDTNYYWKVVSAETNERVVQVDSSCSLADNGCTKEGHPVILIHGFNPEDFELGGGNGTWGFFPKFLNDRGHDVFEFRWITHMRFEEAAGQLAKLINKVAEKTGKKPIVIAHSFGGIVSHLALSGQGIEALNGAWQPVRLKGDKPSDVVKRLITLGSPIGGIFDGDGGLTMAIGRQDNDLSINTCLSITCVQAGAADVIAAMPSLKSNLEMIGYFPPPAGNSLLLAPTDSLKLNYAESIARIGKVTTGIADVDAIAHVLHGVDTVALVGVGSSGDAPTTDAIDKLGDGLISLKGQIHPNDIGSLSDFFQQSELATVRPSSLVTHGSPNVPGLKYVFLPNAGHTNTILHTESARYEYPEPFVAESGEVEYCPGADHTSFRSQLVGRFVVRIPDCDAAKHPQVTTTKHPLVQMLGDGDFLGGVGETYTAAATPQPWDMSGKVSLSGLGTAASSKVPYSMEVRNRNSGEQLVRAFAYATNDAGEFSIDLNVLLDGALNGISRADLYATLFFGDGVSYEVQRVSVQNLNLDAILVPDIVLTPIANQAGLVDFGGKVIDGQTSVGLSEATIRLRRGTNLSVADLMYATDSNTSRVAHTDADGNFYVNQIRPGIYSAVVQRAGYLDEVQGQLTVRADGIISLSLLKTLPDGQAAVTLRWDSETGGPLVARDLDSHLLSLDSLTGAISNHIFYGNPTAPNGDSLDRDDTTYEGPETTTFSPVPSSNYVFYVHKYSAAGTLPGSRPLVILRIGTRSYRFDLPVSADGGSSYWRVFDMVSGQVRPCLSGCLQTTEPTGLGTQSFGGQSVLPANLAPVLTRLTTKH